MYYGEEALKLNKIGSSKSVRLLQMLLLTYPNGIPKNELIDNLYGWNESRAEAANRNRNLNNLIYRLKGQLVACGLPEEEYVELSEGKCRLKISTPLETDVMKLERTIEESIKADREGRSDSAERIELLRRANEMYSGELLPANQSETWFFHKSDYYKSLYVYTIQELEKEYIKNNDYKNRLALYTKAASIYPFDNWQTRLIKCNLEIYRYDEALDIYNSTMELYARELGTPPTAEMQECFEKLELNDKNHRKGTGSPGDWRNMDRVFMGRKNDIKRAIFGEKTVKGAYYCTYPSFVDYCRLVARAKGRNHFEAVLMFLTLSRKEIRNGQKQMNLQEEMTLLKGVLGASLRIGDAYTRYGNRHFILMLVNIEKEFCSPVFSRIESAYAKQGGKGELWYYADMTQELREEELDA
ncbi:MAG: bacterial transcriptional activator domain-containing protein [Ruminococcus flavefaciens]|nr:bacterial transcriptional activator domain-containing protein [Ruminococcus flavefaciens]